MKEGPASYPPLAPATLHILLAPAGEDLHGYGIIRWIYAGILRMHLGYFRQRFGDEMQCIFDEAMAQFRSLPLLADASLIQPNLPVGRRPMACLFFYAGASDTPRPSALIHGGVLSLAVFGAMDAFSC